MNPIAVVIALIWVVVIIIAIKAFLERGETTRLNENTPSQHKNRSEVGKARGAKGGLLRFLTYLPMSVYFDNEGFPARESYIRISEYYFIPPFLYEAGAILGRTRHDKIGLLRKILYTSTSGSEDDIDKVLYRAKKRLEEYERDDLGREPESFRHFIVWTEHRSKSWWCSLDVTAEVSPREVESYLLSLVLEGIEFGSLFPELTRKMNRKFYDSVEIDWDTWIPTGSLAPLILPRHIYGLPGEPTILSLEGQEKTLLRVMAEYIANFHPELIDSLDLRPYQDGDPYGSMRYTGWWRVYDSLQL